jgi:excinuclease ABC subunit C
MTQKVELPGIARAARPAPRELAARLPLAPGVYRFRDAAGRVLYVGRATSLRRRVASYWGDLGDRRHLTRMMPRVARIEAVVCDSVHEAAWLERNLLRTRLPPWNRAPTGGQESEVWIRLSAASRKPCVEIVYQPAPGDRCFGPYLGGRQVRQAVTGLCRVLPLAYAADNATGTRRDMARTLGVTAADRVTLAEAAAAVLDRDPAAIKSLRNRLTARRDAAAGALAFEFAARLQAEIEALEWVTAEQKVTQAVPADFDVYGWSDGTLVRFAVRGGRLSEWAQRSCDESSARPQVMATPPEWTSFAQRTAELAARLAVGDPAFSASGRQLPGYGVAPA